MKQNPECVLTAAAGDIEKDLLDCRAQLGVLTALGQALRQTQDEELVINTALARLGEYLGVARCLYATFEEYFHRVRHEYLGRGPSMLGDYAVSPRGVSLVAQMLEADGPVAVDDVDTLAPAQAAHWRELGVESLVFCPLLVGGSRRAAIIVHNERPRAWSERELFLIDEVVSRCWTFLEQRHGEERLAETESLLHIASRLAKVGGWVMELPSRRVRWTGETNKLLYQGPEYLEGESWVAENVPEEFRQPLAEAMQRCVEQGEPFDVQFQMLVPEGGRVWVRCVARAERDSGGSVTRVLGAYQNIDEQRNLEDQWRQTQKLEAVGHLAGGVAHDFNNLLSVILGYTTLILESEPGEELRADLEEIHLAGERARHLTRQLLAFSRRQVLELTVVDLNELILGMKVLLSKLIGESRELMLELGEQVGLVLGDRGQLEQVVMNLAVNARDAMEGGGTLTIGTKSLHVSAPSPEMPDLALGDYTVLYVKDTGKGLDSSTQARMFEPFFTTKDVGKGTGLGLSTVLGIVKQCRGHIRVNSAPNQGTCFEILLPVTEQLQEESSESHNLAQSESSVAPTILLVEDERPVRKVVCECLKRAGYQVLESHSCVHALNLFETHGATIDVVLSDVIMPGMSGPEVVGQLRAVRPDLKVLYMSGYLGDELMPDEVSREQILFKPFTPSDLVAAVRDLLDS